MLKTSLTLFFVTSVIFSTIYTPQAILPQLQGAFGLSMAQTNLLLTGMLFVLMVATPWYAPIAGRYGARRIMGVATFLLIFSVGLSAVAESFGVLLASRILQGLFVPGITAIMLSYVQAIYPPEHRGLGMGVYMGATGFGAVMGRLVAGWVTQGYGWRAAFGVFVVLLLVALVAMLRYLPDTPVAPKRSADTTRIRTYLTNPAILSILIIPTVVFFAFMAVTTFATYHLAAAPYHLGAGALGSVYLILLLGVAASLVAGRSSDRIGRVRVLGIGIGSLLLGVLLTLTTPLPLIILGIGLVTIGMFTVQSVTPTHLGDLAPDDKPTLAVLYQTFFYFGGAMGTILPAVAWRYGEYAGVGMLAFGLVVLGVVPLTYRMVRQ